MSTVTQITPRTLKGFRDFLPQQMIQRQRIMDIVRKVYESFGYLPIDTPVLEYEDVLMGKYGSEADSLIYHFVDHGERHVAMRYDLTVPLARFVSMHKELPMPFKRYHVAPVWRGEATGKGRFREFVQFDADVCGSSSMVADAEIVCLIYSVMSGLGITNFAIEINNRKVLNGLVDYAGLPPTDFKRVFQIIDKLAKIGVDAVRQELLSDYVGVETQLVNGVECPRDVTVPGFNKESVDKIMEFIAIEGSNVDILAQLKRMFADVEVGLQGVSELKEVVDCLSAMGVEEEKVKVKTSIARGLDYYTGTVYETSLLDRPQFGSVFSGGRFDELIGLFTGKDVPAVGASVGVDRLFAAMEELQLLKEASSVTQVLVAVFPENQLYSLETARLIREQGFRTEVFLGESPVGNPLRTQLRYANQQKLPIVVIPFPEKKDDKIVTIRKMACREQVEVSLDKLVETISQFIGG